MRTHKWSKIKKMAITFRQLEEAYKAMIEQNLDRQEMEEIAIRLGRVPTDATYDPVLPQAYVEEIVRTFDTGATRDLDTTKHDPEGFLSPLVIMRYNEYMTTNRVQKDGSTRDSDNWQKGIPLPVYMKSMWRHFHDVWLYQRGYGYKAKEPLEIALCGLLFNVMGYLHEVLTRVYPPQLPPKEHLSPS